MHLRNRFLGWNRFLGFALIALTCGMARADSVIAPPAVTDPSLSMLELEAELFGLDPSDFYSVAGSDVFWNSSNAALYGNLEALILSLGGNSAMISELFQGGAVFASAPTTNAAIVVSGSGGQSATPEPATMGLLGGTLLLLIGFAVYRARRLRHEVPGNPENGP